MFANGVVDEVRRLGDVGPTAAKTLGLQQIRELLAGANFAKPNASPRSSRRRAAMRNGN